MKENSSYSGSAIFRTYGVVIIVLILMGVFFSYTTRWNDEVDQVAHEKILHEINTALAFTLYQMAVNRDLSKLPRLERHNPFVYLAIYQALPKNYHGAVTDSIGLVKQGWYYDQKTQLVVFVDRKGNMQKYQMVFEFEDKNKSGEFEYLDDLILTLAIKKAS